MISSHPRRDPFELPAAPPRCKTCGRRVATSSYGCVVHGPASIDVSVDEPSQVGTIERPEFPGHTTERLLGRGGFGSVFAVRRHDDGRRLAIKLARSDRPNAARRLSHELHALTDIGAEHVPQVFGSGELAGVPYILMELVEAPTLASWLVAWAGAVPFKLFAEVGPAMVGALAAVHRRGYLHRDLKPENLFIEEGPRVRLVDFGLVLSIEEAHRSHEETKGVVIGTAEYMAPEQCEGRDDIDARADVYAMGVLLYELLAGRPPFWGPSAAVQQSHVGRRPPRLAALTAVPVGVEAVILRCLAKDRSERFDGAEALAVALDRALADSRFEPRIASVVPPPEDDAEPLSARGPSSIREQRRVGLLFFESEHDGISLQSKAASFGGKLAHAAGRRFVAVFGHEGAENPALSALLAGQELVSEGLCERAVVDLAPISVHVRPNGARRFMSPLFGRSERYPSFDDAPGLFLTASAAALLPDVDASAQDERGFSHVAPPRSSRDGAPTVVQSRGARLLGRDRVLQRLLESAVSTVERRAPCIVSVEGDVGHGKTRLCRELQDRLRRFTGVELLVLTARDSVRGASDSVRELLQSVLDLPAVAPPDGGREILAERMGADRTPEAIMAVALALGWVAPDAPELRSLEAAPGALRSALTFEAGEALRRRAQKRPMLLVIDDAHLAGDAALAAIEYATLAEANAPIWVCTFGRPDLIQQRPGWGERAADHAKHELGALDPESAAELCRRLLSPAEDVPDSAIEQLVHRAQAIPLLLVELVRGLKRDGLVRKRSRGDGWYLATDELDRFPDLPLVEWIADREMSALGPGLEAHARLIALLGDEVTVTEVAGVLQRLDRLGASAEVPLDAKVGIQRLLAAGVLVPSEGGGVNFRHALVRESVARASDRLRQRVHCAAYEHYCDESLSIPEERRLVRLAFHADHAGLCENAEAAYLTLAERARAHHAYLEAEHLYTRALAQVDGASPPSSPAPTVARTSAYRGRGQMRYRLARYNEALADLGQAREMADARGDVLAEIDILLDEATALDWMDEYKTSERRVELAQALAGDAPSPSLEARLMLATGRSLHRFSRDKEATVLLETAADRAALLGDEGYETLMIALLLLGFIYPGTGRLDEAATVVSRVVALCEDHGDTLHLVSALNNRALLSACRGDHQGMMDDMRHVLSLARKLGQGTLELVGQYNLGEYLYLMDSVDTAEQHIARAMEIDRRISGAAGRAVVALLHARVLLFRGEEPAAREIAAAIRLRDDEARTWGEVVLVPSEDVLCATIELATREATCAEWDELEERSARFSVGQERIEVLELRALAAWRMRRIDEACRRFERAIAEAERVPNVMMERLVRQLRAARRGEADLR